MTLEHPKVLKNPSRKVYMMLNPHKKISNHHCLNSSSNKAKFQVGDHEWLLQSNLKPTKHCNKLDYKCLGPCIVLDQINYIAFHLHIPSHMCLHLIFHVSLLGPYASSSITDHVVPPVSLVDGLEYKVETILAPKLCNKNCIIWWICQVNIPNGQTWELY